MKRAALIAIVALLLAALFHFFPLFHVIPLERAQHERAATTFDTARFAEQFWRERLLKSLDRAVNANLLLPAIQSDPAAARKKFSRQLGISESYFYFVAGIGRVISATNDEVALAVTEAATQPEVVLPAGLLFGNAVRDATGLLNVNDFPNSQDFNDISQALNHLVETQVLPALREQAKVAVAIRFVGCAEISDESSDLKPLHVVPVQVEFLKTP
jgi:predicted lipoprotein